MNVNWWHGRRYAARKFYRYFGGCINLQEKWLNKMALNGYRLTAVNKFSYEFEECTPIKVRYRIEFVGNKSAKDSKSYKGSLEDLGYKVFYKNINLNYSAGKIRIRPWADKGGKVATNRTTYNKELLIVEKII